jgi:hypothetical protein
VNAAVIHAHPDDELLFAGGLMARYPEWTWTLVSLTDERPGTAIRASCSATTTCGGVVDWAKADLHPDIIDWADVIICHHYEEAWLVNQWPAIRHKRVVWRTCGQSDARKEGVMARLRADGLEIVRYSPKEEEAFTRLGAFAGQDALIRFGKYPADWDGWTGEEAVVGNVTQNMAGRGEFCGLTFWLDATQGLPAKPAGPSSELLPGGIGALVLRRDAGVPAEDPRLRLHRHPARLVHPRAHRGDDDRRPRRVHRPRVDVGARPVRGRSTRSSARGTGPAAGQSDGRDRRALATSSPRREAPARSSGGSMRPTSARPRRCSTSRRSRRSGRRSSTRHVGRPRSSAGSGR